MEDHGKIREDQVYSSSFKIGVAHHGAAYSGPAITKLIIIKRSVIRIEACSFIPSCQGYSYKKL